MEPQGIRFGVEIPNRKFIPGLGFSGEVQISRNNSVELTWACGMIEKFWEVDQTGVYEQFELGDLKDKTYSITVFRSDLMSKRMSERWYRLVDWQRDPRMCVFYDYEMLSGAPINDFYVTARGIVIESARPFDYEWMERVILWLQNLLGDDEFSSELLHKFLNSPISSGSIDEKHITMLLAVLDGNKSVREKHGNEIRDLIAEIRNLNTQSTKVL